MSLPSQSAANISNTLSRERLKNYLMSVGEADMSKIPARTPDASTRTYFRNPCQNSTAIAAVDPEPFDPATQPFLDATRQFLKGERPVLEVLSVN